MRARAASVLACAACGAIAPAHDPYPFRCPNADVGDGADHLLVRMLDLAHAAFPAAAGAGEPPFLRFRTLLHAWHRARAGGLDDAAYVRLVEDCDARVAAVDGHGMRATPCADAPALAAHAGLAPGTPLLVKDETVGVAGSHKARHLFGVLLHLRVAEAAGWTSRAESDRRGLAIASCGNAALAAATLARADGRPLIADIPPDADPRIVARLDALGATTVVCARGEAEGAGDPCVLAFRRAVAAGALPFCCQGNANGLTIEGGMTLAWELVDAWGGRAPERLYVQVGGGALASACAQGLAEAHALGALDRLPRFHAVQTHGAAPLARAYARVRERILARLDLPAAGVATTPAEDAMLAERMLPFATRAEVAEELAFARTHRAGFMWPWESAPHSVAHGILDDETYDWHAVVAGMIASGGFPVTASEERLGAARDAGRAATGIAVDATGAAGLAGLLELRALGVHRAEEPAAVLFTGGARA